MKRIGYFLPFEILLNVYNLLQWDSHTLITYYYVVWENCSKNPSSKLQKLQNYAARVLTISNYEFNVVKQLKHALLHMHNI